MLVSHIKDTESQAIQMKLPSGNSAGNIVPLEMFSLSLVIKHSSIMTVRLEAYLEVTWKHELVLTERIFN